MAPPGGTGMTPFHPLAIALAAGANFVARCFAGDPNGTAAVIAEAIQHPGFSFVAVMSPCVTFREEQREWKDTMRKTAIEATGDAAQAARRLMTDDGYNCGVLYRGNRVSYGKEKVVSAKVSDLEAEFIL